MIKKKPVVINRGKKHAVLPSSIFGDAPASSPSSGMPLEKQKNTEFSSQPKEMSKNVPVDREESEDFENIPIAQQKEEEKQPGEYIC